MAVEILIYLIENSWNMSESFKGDFFNGFESILYPDFNWDLECTRFLIG
jgi:hypothetical protein